MIDFPPNWQGIVDKAKKVDGINPASIAAAGKQFTDAATQAGNHKDAFSSATKSLGEGVWKGPAADAFVDYVTQITKAGDQVQAHLTDVGNDLNKLSVDLGTVKTKVTDAITTAHDAIQKVIDTETAKAQAAQSAQAAHDKDPKNPAPAQSADAIITAANATNQQTATAAEQTIDPLLQQADKMVADSQQLMQTQIKGGYSEVPLPNSDGTVPQSTGGLHTGHGGGGGGGGGHHGGGGGSGGGGGAGGGGLGPSGGPPASPPPGNVQQWIQEAIQALQAAGVNVTDADIKNIWAIIQHESGGNPNAINNWDSNAAAGHPSKGLMQCIDSTFNAHKLPGHDNIYNPVDNIIAGVRYSLDRYGSMSNVPGIAAMAHGGAYRGY